MTSVPKVLLAPDKFKGSLSAPQVAAALAVGIARIVPEADIRRVPVADGGDGTVDAFLAAGWERVEVIAPGPTGQPVSAAYAVRAKTAVIELAAVVGFVKLPGAVPNPLGASTEGLGVVIAHALDRGATNIVLGLGGSASTDGGAGMLRALGARILDQDGREISTGGGALAHARTFERAGLHPGIATAEFTLACDVDNPLLGPVGAVAVYAPQKGAHPGDLPILEAALANWARIVGPEFADRAGAGAAGGTGFGALAVLGAHVRSGIEEVLALLDFPALLDGVSLVVTGEGSLDSQSLHGKAPIGVCEAAREAGVPTIAVVGRTTLTPADIRAAGFTACYSLTALQPDPDRSIADAANLLERIGAQVATVLH
ncbi:glycerate kinase [Nocardia australiensis]|uniref:glycerate kinase n=1 Tax=Nocardia australiensis TaxID=2887191 RepID=UPI001D145E12|nr:glycerate kinase [Nocardia australiensis]